MNSVHSRFSSDTKFRRLRVLEEQHQEESSEMQFDSASVINQMFTRVSVRYGNDIMEEGEAYVSGMNPLIQQKKKKNSFLH